MVDEEIGCYPRTSRQAFGVEFDRLRPDITFLRRRRVNWGWVGFALAAAVLLCLGL